MLSAHQRMSCSNRTSPLRTRTTMSPLSRCSSMSTLIPFRYTTRLFGLAPFSTSCSAQTSVIWLAVEGSVPMPSLWFPCRVKA